MTITLPLFTKSFFFCSLLAILILLCVLVKEMNIENVDSFERKTYEKLPNMKYILRWTSSKNIPFVYMGEGRQGFIDRNCPYTNCFVTGDRNYLGDYRNFDVIVFAGPEVVRMKPPSLPQRRSPHQKYVFGSLESSDYYPVCSNRFDGYFNWTWTFKLKSDSRWGYIVVRDADNNIVGPKIDMQWIKFEDMDPVSTELKEEINKSKIKVAAWLVSNCYSKSGREKFVRDLQWELKKYGLSIDVYGDCGSLSCAKETIECLEMVKDYYFYLAFENSFCEDYVTEKLLTALKYTAIPIVYGAANYTRFMPDGIYLNARELGVKKLAAKMSELIENPDKYVEYFRWKKYYSYYEPEESIETNDYCKFCAILNDNNLMRNVTVYQNFKEWWDPPGKC